eukprot:208043-Pleurochrysis_carterae.AAC.2
MSEGAGDAKKGRRQGPNPARGGGGYSRAGTDARQSGRVQSLMPCKPSIRQGAVPGAMQVVGELSGPE